MQFGLAATTVLAWTPAATAQLAAAAEFNYPDVVGGITSDQYDLVKDITIVSATQHFIVGWGIHEDRTTKPFNDANAYTQAFVAVTDSAGAVSGSQVVGTIVPGETTEFHAVAWTPGTVYAVGNYDSVSDVCPGHTADGSRDGLVFAFAEDLLSPGSCMAVASTDGKLDELVTAEFADGALWVAGSSAGTVDANYPNAGRDAACSLGGNDILLARIDPANLASPSYFEYGTTFFDEVQGAAYDDVNDVLYVSGNTHGGNFCDQTAGLVPAPKESNPSIYGINSSTLINCTYGGGDVFDSIVAAFQWNGSSWSHKWVYQFGMPGEDAGQDIALYRDPNDGTVFLYVSGRTESAIAGYFFNTGDTAQMKSGTFRNDFYLVRLEIDSNTGLPTAVLDSFTGTYVNYTSVAEGFTSDGESGQALYVGQTNVWLAGAGLGTTDHAGVCGGGKKSKTRGFLAAYNHQTLAPYQFYVTGKNKPTGFTGLGFNPDTSEMVAVGQAAHDYVKSGPLTRLLGLTKCGKDTKRFSDDELDGIYFTSYEPTY